MESPSRDEDLEVELAVNEEVLYGEVLLSVVRHRLVASSRSPGFCAPAHDGLGRRWEFPEVSANMFLRNRHHQT